MKFLKEHNTTSEYIDDFMCCDWYNTPECYAMPSVSYISEDLSLHCFNPREKKNVPTNQFWYKSKGNHVIIPYNTDCFIGDNNTILQIISHKYDPRVGLNVIELSGELKIIGENAFYRKDEGFKEIYMPDSVIEIQWLAFRQIGYGNIYIFNSLKI